MKIDFTPKLFYDAATSIAGAVGAGGASPLGLATAATGIGLGALQGLIGLFQQGKANKQLKKLFSQRKAFQTPKEIFDILNLSQFNAQTGFGSQTLDYLTSQAGRGLSATLGAATRLGANPNDVSGAYDQYLQDIFKTGGESELLKMKKFDNVFNALKLNADSKAAEWQSKENLLKDEMQMQGQKAQAGAQNIQSGANLFLGGMSSLATQNLWKDQLEQIKGILSGGTSTTSTSMLPNTNTNGVGTRTRYNPITGQVERY